jgi:hypothetical protein
VIRCGGKVVDKVIPKKVESYILVSGQMDESIRPSLLILGGY